ncbi:O-acetyl-ADP-ribose deacetylase (regulator of RNase III), contains Macro domain [Paenibacillus algorifonticola]|uniref:Protein-ADP-ribose hydrolase n=2 Tax=Paenibacillus algorifonticola TaxID=684063 RepID=A0A1I1Z0D6_9BACL|nr:O-acetyl-ADP-ribose deacetylase (regulator of RNase III), contains Macro domain [Paenibacillus algorifonticola]
MQITLMEYASLVHLTDRYMPAQNDFSRKEEMVNDLLESLLEEQKQVRKTAIPHDYMGKRNLLKGLLNVREPAPLAVDFLNKLDTLLQTELKEKGIIDVEHLDSVSTLLPHCSFSQSDKFSLWQGDITRLGADAIVNAANKYMLGCFQPYHACIDNAIHTTAGPKLREDCNIIMSIQGEPEATGGAKITRGYNLPARFVLHTVGPIVSKGTELIEQQRADLAACYRCCLELANEIDEIRTVAFCSISTGVFGFPKPEASKIAVQTVNEWLNTHTHHFEKIIFNVFSDDDYTEYLHVFQS